VGPCWGGFGGGFWGVILGGIARAGFSHRESTLPDPLNYYKQKLKIQDFEIDEKRIEDTFIISQKKLETAAAGCAAAAA
jgi:hypothetical protein